MQPRGPATFLKRDSNTDVLPVKFPKFLRKKGTLPGVIRNLSNKYDGDFL